MGDTTEATPEEVKETADEQPKEESKVVDADNEETKDASANEASSEPVAPPSDKYMLLKYLFRFVQTRQYPLNPVLSGYFAKLLILLLNRKQKQVVPFIFSAQCGLIDDLLFHVYQKSVSEVLNKLLNISEQSYEEDLSKAIKERQLKAVAELVGKLASQQIDDEANLNASLILCELMDNNKDSFNVLSRKSVQQAISNVIHANGSDKSSKCAAMVVLSRYIYQYKNGKEENDSDKGGDDDDDIIIKNQSDSDDEKATDKDKVFNETLLGHIEPMIKLFRADPTDEGLSQLNGESYRPLGVIRLRAIELLNQIVKVDSDAIYLEVLRSNVMAHVMELCLKHTWNNLLHIKTFEIWECIFKSRLTAQQKFETIKESKAITWILLISKETQAKFATDRKTRNGNMAFAVKLANLFKA